MTGEIEIANSFYILGVDVFNLSNRTIIVTSVIATILATLLIFIVHKLLSGSMCIIKPLQSKIKKKLRPLPEHHTSEPDNTNKTLFKSGDLIINGNSKFGSYEIYSIKGDYWVYPKGSAGEYIGKPKGFFSWQDARDYLCTFGNPVKK